MAIVENLLTHNKIKLAKNGVFLDRSVVEQISLFERAFPIDRREMVLGRAETNSSGPRLADDFDKMSEDAKIFEESLWFFREECPAGVVWIADDGSEEVDLTPSARSKGYVC